MAAFAPDANGFAAISVSNDDGSSILVYQQGAHLASWKTSAGEMLYVSPAAVKQDRVALRGGVPIIFPQFGNRGQLTPSHGFARIRPWKVEEASNGRAVFSFFADIDELNLDSHASDVSQPHKHAVELRYTITFDDTNLKLHMRVHNVSEEVAAPFHFCFHTYFRVNDVDQTVVNGFNRSPFYDQTKKIDGKNESMKLNPPVSHWAIRKGAEVDRIYPNQPCAVMLQQPHQSTTLHISSTQLPDVVLWNPGEEKCKKDTGAFKDLPEDAYKHFICVEHGQIIRKIVVRPGGTWEASQNIRVMAPTPASSKM